MKEKPILFSTAMVKRILDGDKSQTRRIIKGLTFSEGINNEIGKSCGRGVSWKNLHFTEADLPKIMIEQSPFRIGMRLWVRETFITSQDAVYYADDERFWDLVNNYKVKKRPSIFMPRGASRLILEITNIRVEKLQEITEEDAKKEGVWGKDEPCQGVGDLPTDRFRDLWESIYGEGSWESNPFVWVIEFRTGNIDPFIRE